MPELIFEPRNTSQPGKNARPAAVFSPSEAMLKAAHALAQKEN